MRSVSSNYAHLNLSTCSIINFMVEDDLVRGKTRITKFTYACCCPCIVTGQIQSKLTRDQEFQPNKYLNRCPCGSLGLFECMKVGIFCVCGWVCSPCLAVHIFRQRELLIELYKDKMTQSNLPENLMCMWPCALYQNMLFIEYHERQKTLRFLEGKYVPRPPLKEIKVVLVGPDNSGRSSLFTSLLLLLPTTKVITDEHAKTGLRAYKCLEDSIAFVSIVDVPEVKLPYKSFMQTINNGGVDFILFCFDASDPKSLESCKITFETLSYFSGERVLVALKMELVPNEPPESDELESVDGRETFEDAVEWAEQTNMKLFDVSTVQNVGVNQLYHLITGKEHTTL